MQWWLVTPIKFKETLKYVFVKGVVAKKWYFKGSFFPKGFKAIQFMVTKSILPPRQIKSTVRLCQRIKNRRRQIQTFDQNNN